MDARGMALGAAPERREREAEVKKMGFHGAECSGCIGGHQAVGRFASRRKVLRCRGHCEVPGIQGHQWRPLDALA